MDCIRKLDQAALTKMARTLANDFDDTICEVGNEHQLCPSCMLHMTMLAVFRVIHARCENYLDVSDYLEAAVEAVSKVTGTPVIRPEDGGFTMPLNKGDKDKMH